MQYRQYTAGAAASTSTSTMDIRQDDTIVQVVLDLAAIQAIDGDTYYAELSWQQTPSPTTNDISNVIASVFFDFQLLTSGAGVNARSITVEPNIKVFQGERLYLHVVATGVGTAKAYAMVVTGKEPPKAAARR